MLVLVLGAIVLGCAAYEAGNILGGVAGAVLATGWSSKLLTLVSGTVAGCLLLFGAPKTVARVLSIFVAIMGIAFLVTAVLSGHIHRHQVLTRDLRGAPLPAPVRTPRRRRHPRGRG